MKVSNKKIEKLKEEIKELEEEFKYTQLEKIKEALTTKLYELKLFEKSVKKEY